MENNVNVPQKIKIDLGFPGGSDGKASACNAGDPGSIPGLGRSPRRRKWQSTPPLLPGKSHGRRRLIGYSPWGRKESDTTERLDFILSSNSTSIYPEQMETGFR